MVLCKYFTCVEKISYEDICKERSPPTKPKIISIPLFRCVKFFVMFFPFDLKFQDFFATDVLDFYRKSFQNNLYEIEMWDTMEFF